MIHYKHIYCAAALLLLAGMVHAQDRKWKLVWSEEFNYNGLPDPEKWSYNLGDHGWGNREKQNYIQDTSTAHVYDGKLHLTARMHVSGDDTTYTSARLVTKNKGDWKYGKVEVRAKVADGRGICSAIWMMPTNAKYGGWPASGEIDIMEHIGLEKFNDSIFQTVHTGAYNHKKNTQRGVRKHTPAAWTDFHLYGIEWNAQEIFFLLDGKKTYRFPNNKETSDEWPFDDAFHLLMNISVGGNWEGAEGIDPRIFPATMEVDYIKVYQKK